MAPTQPENAQTASATNNEQRQSPQGEMQEISLQPMASQPMDPERPHEDSQMNLRGGDRGGWDGTVLVWSTTTVPIERDSAGPHRSRALATFN
ncbi:hypothetical protein NPX13_g10816 [Xylaria arbuscula]|uniref:Uncharacterized protein n=1 Tax=Xylaria arbuscula TaxID=114810 RepID=A0A9W8N4C0_9PEZI|nr:hypothetical protein NPX13_g10816 [Xylaria arbuscula]